MKRRKPALLTIDEQLLDDESLVMRIDSVLDDAVWQGTRAIDRVTHLTNQFVPTLLTELNRSLHQQENYDEFEDRLLRAVGVEDPDAPAGVLGDLDRLLGQEVRLAYNQGSVALNDGPDMIPVWEAILDDRTTPGCWENHGQTIEELGGMVPPLHWGCYSADTRVLTDKGFRFFPELYGDERFLSMDPETGVMEWVRAVRWIENRHVGGMVAFQARNFDLLVTPDHRMAYVSDWQRHQRDRRIRFKSAASMSATDSIPRGGQWRGDEPAEIDICGERYPAALFMEFLGWFLAEGCVSGPRQQVAISQYHDGRRAEINVLCQRLFGMPPSRAQNAVYVSRPYGSDTLRGWLCGLGQQPERYVPRAMKELAPSLLKLLLYAFNAGDGSEYDIAEQNSHKGVQWAADWRPFRVNYTSSPRLADDLAEMILKCGGVPSFYRSHLKERGKPHQFANGTYVIKHPCVGVAENHRRWRGVRAMKHVEPYAGDVYCVELERHHLLYVERNGRCTWCGNCRCLVRMIPDPQSTDAEFAALGAAVVEDMRADREQEFRESAVECHHRFSRLREVLAEELCTTPSSRRETMPKAS